MCDVRTSACSHNMSLFCFESLAGRAVQTIKLSFKKFSYHSNSSPTDLAAAAAVQGPICLDPTKLPAQVRGCCKEPCSTYVDPTTGQPTSGVCCPSGSQTVVLPDRTTARICCPKGSTAQPDGTCCKSSQLCAVLGFGTPACCPEGQTCTGGRCTTITSPCTSPNVKCAFWPSLEPGDCCRACLPGWSPTPLPGQALGADVCCPAVSEWRCADGSDHVAVTFA
jgi:hypothetical protein